MLTEKGKYFRNILNYYTVESLLEIVAVQLFIYFYIFKLNYAVTVGSESVLGNYV